jgi:hypothetical protein
LAQAKRALPIAATISRHALTTMIACAFLHHLRIAAARGTGSAGVHTQTSENRHQPAIWPLYLLALVTRRAMSERH